MPVKERGPRGQVGTHAWRSLGPRQVTVRGTECQSLIFHDRPVAVVGTALLGIACVSVGWQGGWVAAVKSQKLDKLCL